MPSTRNLINCFFRTQTKDERNGSFIQTFVFPCPTILFKQQETCGTTRISKEDEGAKSLGKKVSVHCSSTLCTSILEQTGRAGGGGKHCLGDPHDLPSHQCHFAFVAGCMAYSLLNHISIKTSTARFCFPFLLT